MMWTIVVLGIVNWMIAARSLKMSTEGEIVIAMKAGRDDDDE